jgi:hypothetical protein
VERSCRRSNFRLLPISQFPYYQTETNPIGFSN